MKDEDDGADERFVKWCQNSSQLLCLDGQLWHQQFIDVCEEEKFKWSSRVWRESRYQNQEKQRSSSTDEEHKLRIRGLRTICFGFTASTCRRGYYAVDGEEITLPSLSVRSPNSVPVAASAHSLTLEHD